MTISKMQRFTLRWAIALGVIAPMLPNVAKAQAKKPNILVIFGDDIGQSNISAYGRGVMGFTTPNIDRIGNGGGDRSPTNWRHRAQTGDTVLAEEAAREPEYGRGGRRWIGSPSDVIGEQDLLAVR